MTCARLARSCASYNDIIQRSGDWRPILNFCRLTARGTNYGCVRAASFRRSTSTELMPLSRFSSGGLEAISPRHNTRSAGAGGVACNSGCRAPWKRVVATRGPVCKSRCERESVRRTSNHNSSAFSNSAYRNVICAAACLAYTRCSFCIAALDLPLSVSSPVLIARCGSARAPRSRSDQTSCRKVGAGLRSQAARKRSSWYRSSWRGLRPGALTPGDSRLITSETTPPSFPTNSATAPSDPHTQSML
jgi:hypothetical protein